MAAQQRTYYCIDMKSFYASVECAERGLNPFETNLVVADLTRGQNALCLAITPAMKAQGIKNRCRLKELEDRRGQLQSVESQYAEVKAWLDTFIEQTMKENEVTTVDGTTLKMLVDRILVRDNGIEVAFSCGVSIEKEYVR